MHVFSIPKLRAFWEEQDPLAEEPMRAWYKLLSNCEAKHYPELKLTFNSADMIEDYTIFDVGGNKYRIIVHVHFETGNAYILEVMTHGDYETGSWKKRLGIKA